MTAEIVCTPTVNEIQDPRRFFGFGSRELHMRTYLVQGGSTRQRHLLCWCNSAQCTGVFVRGRLISILRCPIAVRIVG